LTKPKNLRSGKKPKFAFRLDYGEKKGRTYGEKPKIGKGEEMVTKKISRPSWALLIRYAMTYGNAQERKEKGKAMERTCEKERCITTQFNHPFNVRIIVAR